MTKFNANKLVSEFPIRVTRDGFHQYRNDYKKSSIQGTHVTFKRGCTHALTVAHVPMVLENNEKESDNLIYVAKNPNERMSRQAIETLNEVKDDVKHGDMIHAFNRLHITNGICPTLTTRPEGFKTASLVVEDINEKERDNLAKSSERYVLDEQA